MTGSPERVTPLGVTNEGHGGKTQLTDDDNKPIDKPIVLTEAATAVITKRIRVRKPPLPYRYALTLPFNADSHLQIKALIRSLGLKVPKARGEDRETADAKYLKRFGAKGGKYAVFNTILECKQRGKLLSTYNWRPNERGRVTTTYGWHPSTLRKSSRQYNLQNIPKRSDLAAEFRRMIRATDGCYLIEGDSAAIEAVFVGYAAGSTSYINLAKAGVHGWLTSHIAKQPIDWQLPLPQLSKLCKAAKKLNPVIYEAAKRCIHGSNYLLSPFGMYDEYQEFFPTEASAATMQAIYYATEPGRQVRAWQRKVMDEAHSRQQLTNHYDYRHYFYSVYRFDMRRHEWAIDHQGDAKRAVAFIPQSDASAFQTEALLKLAAIEEMLSYLRLIIHDSFVLEVPYDRASWAASTLYEIMTAPIAEMGGLTVGAEVKYGMNLAPVSVDNPNGMNEVEIEEAAA